MSIRGNLTRPIVGTFRSLAALKALSVLVATGGRADITAQDGRTMLFDTRFLGASLVVVVRRVSWRRVRLCLVTDQPMVRRLLAASGLRLLLSTQPTVEAALARFG
jgi:hypothetical protein